MQSVAGFRGSTAAAVMFALALFLGLALDGSAAPIKNGITRGQAVENERQNCTIGEGGVFSSVEGTGANAGATFTWCDSAEGTRACKITAKTVECSDKTTIVAVPAGPVVTMPTPTSK